MVTLGENVGLGISELSIADIKYNPNRIFEEWI
jgi:hypothetical protein